MTEERVHRFLGEAIELAVESARSGRGGPFGAVVVKGEEIVGRGSNRVTSTDDPTAHAEIEAIREAAARLGSFRLDGCVIYCSSEPCPMCLGAIYWARLDGIYYANRLSEAAAAGFSDAFIYEELARAVEARRLPTERVEMEGAEEPFAIWAALEDRVDY